MISSVSNNVDYLKKIREKDEEFFAEMREKHGAATFCAECRRNTHAGLYPFWHRYARTLCSDCGREYSVFLKRLGAVDD